MIAEALVVLTFKSVDTLLKQGGTSSWRLDRAHARRCAYAICTRNGKDRRCEGPEPHHTGFLVGKVLDVVPAPNDDGDFLVEFSEYALIDIPEVWKGDRNPVRYAKIEDLEAEFDLRLDALDWQPMPAKPTGAAVATADLCRRHLAPHWRGCSRSPWRTRRRGSRSPSAWRPRQSRSRSGARLAGVVFALGGWGR